MMVLMLSVSSPLMRPAAPGTSAPAASGPAAGPPQAEALAHQVAQLFGPTFRNTPWIGWAVLLGGVIAGIVAGRMAHTVLRGMAARLKGRGWPVRAVMVGSAAGPAALALFAAALGLGFQGLAMTAAMSAFTMRLIGFLHVFAAAWFLYNLVDLAAMGLHRFTARTASRLDDMLVPLVRKGLRLFLIIVFTLFIAENFFGADITAWLAGLGIAGLAVSLAAQDSVKNLFGSLTVLLDRPFAIGDRISFDRFDGVVESIGFRSTRIRTLTGHLVTVPNMKFTDSVVENISARPMFRRTMNITIAYDTPPAKVEEAVGIVRGILTAPDIADCFDMVNRPPRIHFNEFNTDSLSITAMYWYDHGGGSAVSDSGEDADLASLTDAAGSSASSGASGASGGSGGRDWWTFQAHAERINHRLLRAFAEAGIEFAFPTRTVFLAADPKRPFAAGLTDAHSRSSSERAPRSSSS
jgi:MscS family membrane protein